MQCADLMVFSVIPNFPPLGSAGGRPEIPGLEWAGGPEKAAPTRIPTKMPAQQSLKKMPFGGQRIQYAINLFPYATGGRAWISAKTLKMDD
jgi:hypothetical protein